MTDEYETLRRENDQLRHEFKQHKTETEADMKILEANLAKSLADNREAFERLRADVFKSVTIAATILGAFIAFTGLFVGLLVAFAN